MKLKKMDTSCLSKESERNFEIAFKGVNASFTAMVRLTGLLCSFSMM